MLEKLLSVFPSLEVIGRNLYWRSKFFHRVALYILNRRSSILTSAVSSDSGNIDFFLNSMSKLGINKGDILIVHSSFAALKKFGLSPHEMIHRLLLLVGETGTLVMPAIPIFKEEPAAIDRFDDALYAKPFTYNLQTSRIWTGALPQALLKMSGAVRSRHPLNSIVAYGAHAQEMIAHELVGDKNLPCGEGSTWAYCYRKNAKILMLGVDTVHSLTMIHVAEDLFEDQWQIRNWYRERAFRIIDGDKEQIKRMHERKPKWALFYAERRFSRDLQKNNIVKDVINQGIKLSLIESKNLIEFLNNRKASAYPYYIPFWLK